MRIVVCVKPVPDPRQFHRLSVDPERGTLIREGVPLVINPLDRNALEEALRLREAHCGEVWALSMAPPHARSVMREALAMGADRAVLLSDASFAGSDTLATAYVLSCGLRKVGQWDLILCGEETVDGGTAQVSPQLAEFLELPNVMHATRIRVSAGRRILVSSRMEHGEVDVELPLPAVVSVVRDINDPRHITLMNILQAEQKEITTWSGQDLEIDGPWVGLDGSPTRMLGLSEPKARKRAEILQGTPEEQAEELARRLHRMGFV